jgi:hypothetical protein
MSIINNLRSYRLLGMAIFDWVVTLVSAIIVIYVFNLNWTIVLLAIIPLTILSHAIFQTETTLMRYYNESVIIKIIVVLLFLASTTAKIT